MAKNRRPDLISEEEYNQQVAHRRDSPLKDSPGDSEAATASEFMMGFNYTPSGQNVPVKNDRKKFDDLPDTAKVVSSDLPSPALDFDKETDTH